MTAVANTLTWREFNRLESLEWGEKHFGSLATGRTFRRPAMLRLVDRGLVRSVGLVEMCDGDGWTICPQRIGEGFVMTDAGREALAAWRTAHCARCGSDAPVPGRSTCATCTRTEHEPSR